MNEEIETLTLMLERAELEHSHKRDEYKKRLLNQWEKVFENDNQLEKDANNALSASEYGTDENGIYSWYRVKTDLKTYKDAREYLEEYLSDKYNLTVDWKNDCFVSWQGDDNYIIQDDTRHDNGVWQGHDLIFDQDLYTNEDGTINIQKRNELIEGHMEKEGYFPGVFKVNSYGNVTFIKTNTKGDIK
jgi:hypothetical protein